MKIAVVTNYDTKNYGSVLQAYALQKNLTELGAESFVLQKKSQKKYSLAERAKRFLIHSGNNYTFREKYEIKKSRKLYVVKNKKLNIFCSNNINVRVANSLEEASLITGDVDAFIAGSDQIWSSTAGTLSPFTLLQFGAKRIKRYSFAASVGMESIPEEVVDLIESGLNQLDDISVREKSSIDLLQPYTNTSIHSDIDPTFLYDSSFWDKHTCEIPNKDYIFVYMLRPEPLTMALAGELSKRTGLKVCVFSNRIVSGNNIENIIDAGIEEFLTYIKNAAYVVTNSFHGTAFAVQFHKKFVSVAISGSGMRVRDFLTSIGLENYIAKSVEDIEKINVEPVWETIDERIDSLREKSKSYLSKIVNGRKKVDINNEEVILFNDKMECTGCGACKNICPTSAIVMGCDEDGFYYPKINKDTCIKCRLCKTVCNYQNGILKTEIKESLAAIAKKEDIRMKSSSGGVFTAIAKAFIEHGGVVFGCEMQKRSEGLTPAHISIESLEELPKLQSSKYAQSDIGMSYKQVKQFLVEGRKVLFSGTPCQISGLYGYLRNKKHENLYTIDLICHGVPSAEILQGYIRTIEKKNNSELLSINFRDKNYGWGQRGSYQLSLPKGKHVVKYFDNFTSSFYYLYLKSAFYRDSCYSCRYTNLNRTGDITIGDYWGIKVQEPQLFPENGGTWNLKQGISCILISSEQGAKLISSYGRYIESHKTSIEKITFKNKMLLRPSKVNANRATILKLYRQGGYEAVDNWFKMKFGRRNLVYGTWDKLPLSIRKTLKKIIN